MDPTQDQAETRKLMASIKEALDKIINEFKHKRQEVSPTETSVRRQA